MQWMTRLLATAAAAGMVTAAWDVARNPAQADLVAPEPKFSAPSDAPDAWIPPSWHPAPDQLAVLTDMGGHATSGLAEGHGPALSARSVFVYDVDAGQVLYDRAADDRRPVASLTKLVSSLAMASESPDLDRELCIDPQFWPSRNGARSHLSTGECYQGWDLLGAALVASDNRAAYGLQVLSGLPFGDFVARMNEVSGQLGMSNSTWADPSGLEDDNLSTARDMTHAVLAVAAHPILSIAATAPSWHIDRLDAPGHRTLFSTDKMAVRDDLEVLAAKTGYTDTAGYCFSGVFRTASGRKIALTILGDGSTAQRWSDVSRILGWVDQGQPAVAHEAAHAAVTHRSSHHASSSHRSSHHSSSRHHR